MPSIESLNYPIVYKAVRDADWLLADGLSLRTEVRALEGMQKEALVSYSPTKTLWRMVSDEGPFRSAASIRWRLSAPIRRSSTLRFRAPRAP